MKITLTDIPDVLILEPEVFGDHRGYFLESYNKNKLPEIISNINFVQDNESKSQKGVLRGLHFQIPPFCQSKLVRVIQGDVLDIAVDIRKGSPTFGKHVAVSLTSENKKQLFVPRGFAHGFVVLSDTAIFSYKCDNYYSPKHNRGVNFSDPELGIDWKINIQDAILSEKDNELPSLKNCSDLFDFNVNLYE